MKKRVKSASCILAILMMLTLLAGCGEKPKEVVTVNACLPVEWIDAHIWAWKDGGEDVFAAWPGELMGYGTYCFTHTVPGWVDRLVFSTNNGTVQTGDIPIEPGKDVWIIIFEDLTVDVFYEDIFEGYEEWSSPYAEDPIYQAAEQGDFETVKKLLPEVKDRTMLTDWAFNDFNYAYALESIKSGDYETAVEFFKYCAYEDYQQHAVFLQQLMDGDVEGACDTKKALDFTTFEDDLGMTWPEFVCTIIGIDKDPTDINYILLNNYLTRRIWYSQRSLSAEALTFGEYSTWTAEDYVSDLQSNDYYLVVDSLNSLYQQCGSEPNGKVLILRGQKQYSNGQSRYAIDLNIMNSLSYDLYPSNLSEVEYIILADYSYTKDGRYKQTFTMGENSVVSYFTFLRMKGQVTLMDAAGKTIEKYKSVSGTGEVDLNFSENDYQCSNMPETGSYIIEAMEKIKQMNGTQAE